MIILSLYDMNTLILGSLQQVEKCFTRKEHPCQEDGGQSWQKESRILSANITWVLGSIGLLVAKNLIYLYVNT